MKKNLSLLLILFSIIFLGFLNAPKAKTTPKENTTYLNIPEELFKPIRIKDTFPEIKASVASSILLNDNKKIILYEKNLEKETPIASLTKLMTAVIVLDNYPLDSIILIDEDMLKAWGTSINLRLGEHVTIKDLLNIMLLESNNDASECLAAKLNRENFIILMNEKAKELKMKNTIFLNPSGLDEDNDTYNISSAKDLTILTAEIIKNYPEIVEILSKTEYDFISESQLHYKIYNTNAMLKEFPYDAWGKTGYTLKANECLVLMTKTPQNDTIINVIINSNDRFQEMRKLTNWVNNSFSF